MQKRLDRVGQRGDSNISFFDLYELKHVTCAGKLQNKASDKNLRKRLTRSERIDANHAFSHKMQRMAAHPTLIHDNVSLIETADKLLLDTFFADPTTRPFLLVRLSDTAALVQPNQFDALLARMKKQGHTPKVLES